LLIFKGKNSLPSKTFKIVVKSMNMHRLILLVTFLFVLTLGACSDEEEDIYTGRMEAYQLEQTSEYDFSGVATVRELRKGGIEIQIQLTGPSTDAIYHYPAHLHHGDHRDFQAPMAQMLNPIDARVLLSITSLDKLADGSAMNFDRFLDFEGHIKIHLAEDGPDYEIILASGNVGKTRER
jgi:hypothetical protein